MRPCQAGGIGYGKGVDTREGGWYSVGGGSCDRLFPKEVEMLMGFDFASHLAGRSEDAASLLSSLITFRSTHGDEQAAQQFLADHVRRSGFEAELVPIHPGIEQDEDYTLVPGHKGYKGRSNLCFTVPGSGGGKSIILSTHVDVVPGGDDLFEPRYEDGIMRGRGACDAKGHVVTALLALEALREAGVRLRGDVHVQFVIEEEAGGNGALSAILDCPKADGVVVLESTGLKVFCANRGALWFKLAIEGKTTHMGRWRDGVSAIDEMTDAIRILKDYEARLIEESCGDPLFEDVGGCVKVNIGVIQGGEWPSMVPGHCFIEGGIGFLPNKTLQVLREELRREIEVHADEWTRKHFSIEYSRLHNEAYRMPPDHPLAVALGQSVMAQGLQTEVTGWTASCDARLYYHRGGMPTVVFGPGSVSHAHSVDEQISVRDILTGARILADFLVRWCGAEREE